MLQPATDDVPVTGTAFAPDLHDARHLWLKAGLLLVWALVSFGACYFARDLQMMVAGWPLGYWIAAQGAILVFIAVAVVYCVAMDRFERKDAASAAVSAVPTPSSPSPPQHHV
ncbi:MULTISPECIES: DUF4212 domain-containing protein [unclassified Acidovorax]|uniref:DUF4212 domain-containing protein n=1 Tax=unclassified Acidovorax TaxID=2684926 RepID=UPI002883066F|nr:MULTISPECIES: DUF4212 domain-containing protein [unclassified Acidovorax]